MPDARVRYERSSEFFGFGAWLRSLVYPLSRRFLWSRYVLAIIAFGLLVGFAKFTHGWLQVACLIAWLLIGLTWFLVFSQWRDVWWTRKRGSTVVGYVGWTAFAILVIGVTSMSWFFWMAIGNRGFDFDEPV